ALRQHIRPNERVHGTFSDGGGKPNIVPARAATAWMVRSRTIRSLGPLRARVHACLQAGADAAGCEADIRWDEPAYADMVDNPVMVALWSDNATALGRPPIEPAGGPEVVGSTD